MAKNLNGKKLEEHLQKLAQAQGSDSHISVLQVADAGSISAHIDFSTEKIEFQIPEAWNPSQYSLISRFAKKSGITDSVRKICEDVAFHEIGHARLKNDKDGLGCPEDLKGKEIAVDAVSKAMLENSRFSQQGELYLENCISDIIDNLNCSQYASLNGLSLFFAEQGEINNGKFSPLYEAFVKLNMHLSGKNHQKKMLKRYFTNDKSVDEAVSSCLKEIGLSQDRKHNLGLLFDKSRWHETFYKFAKHLSKLMDKSSPEFLPGSGSAGKGYKVPASFGKKADFGPESIDDVMLKRVLDSDNMKKAMQRRNSNGEQIPCFIEQWKALDYFYQGLASELRINAEVPKKGEKMPIAPIGARQFDAEKDSLENILFGRILIDEHGKPCLAVPRSHVEITAKYKKTIKSYPELNIAVLDSSTSMLEPANERGKGRTNIVPWGDNSKYHYSLLAYYGVEKALHKIGIGTRTRYNLITFSSETEATGEKGHEDNASIKKRILNPEFGNSTNINVDVLAKHTREPGSVLMTISDGEIHNWDVIKDDFKRIISDKFYVHFQIGKSTEATADLESWGATVVKITDASQMPKKAIDIAQRFYKSYASGEPK